MSVDSSLDALRRKLHSHVEGEGDVIFTRLDGKTVRIDNVRVDSISPIAENNGVIGVEFFDSDRVVHVPFVSHWEIEYRF